jgi:hypothetical protein
VFIIAFFPTVQQFSHYYSYKEKQTYILIRNKLDGTVNWVVDVQGTQLKTKEKHKSFIYYKIKLLPPQ